MWIVELHSQSMHGWYRYYQHEFNTEEEANTFMVKEIFDAPSYEYRVRFEEEK